MRSSERSRTLSARAGYPRSELVRSEPVRGRSSRSDAEQASLSFSEYEVEDAERFVSSLVEQRVVLPFDEFAERFQDDGVKQVCRGCRKYGKNWSCPPFGTDGAASMPEGFAEGFGAIELVCYQVIPAGFAGDLTDRAAVERFKQGVLRAAKSTMVRSLLGSEHAHPGASALFPCSCELCGIDGCNRAKGLPCAHPAVMRTSLEALGYDVGRIVEDLFGLGFCWASEGEIPAHYILVGALLIP